MALHTSIHLQVIGFVGGLANGLARSAKAPGENRGVRPGGTGRSIFSMNLVVEWRVMRVENHQHPFFGASPRIRS